MLLRTAFPGRPRYAARLVLAVLAGHAAPSAAQELELKREYPGSSTFECAPAPAFDPPSEEARTQAAQLASGAGQAVILGDLGRARTLLARATQVDPSSAELAYRHARVLEDLGERQAAMAELCRFLAFGSEPEGTSDARERLETLADNEARVIPPQAIEAFTRGLALADEGAPESAARFFTTALQWAPDWGEAAYNHGVMMLRLGRRPEAAFDFRRYLELTPDASDAVTVSQRLGQLEAAPSRQSAGTALTLGMILPGMGQFYTGRALGGLTVLALAGGAAATGVLVEEVNVSCLIDVGAGEECPLDLVVREDTERPYLIPALGVAAAVTVIGAIEAFMNARSARDEPPVLTGAAPDAGPRLQGPSVAARGVQLELSLLRLTFR